jgi:hypothetical protein
MIQVVKLCSMATLLFVAVAPFPTITAQTRDRVQEEAIRAAREQWNRAVGKRDTAAFRALLSGTYRLTSGYGHIFGQDSAVAGAARLFAQRPDLFYEAHPTRIRVMADHGLASEYGEWVERWRVPSGLTELRGTYYVFWRSHGGRWLIEGEVNVPEACTGSDYCKPR